MAALPEAVVFDLDGVLTRTDRYHYLKALGADPRQSIGVEAAAVGMRAIKAAGMYAIGGRSRGTQGGRRGHSRSRGIKS